MTCCNRHGRIGRLSIVVWLTLLGLVLAAVSSRQSFASPSPPARTGRDPADTAYPYVGLAPMTPGGPPRRAAKTTMTKAGHEVLANRILLTVARGTSDADLAAISQQAAKLGAGAATPLLTLRNGSYLVDVSGAASVEAAAAAYRAADRRVVAASPDSIVHGADALQPNDPFQPWYQGTIQAPAAWARTHGDAVQIGVLDSGIKESHPDLAGKVDGGTNVLWFSSSTDDESGHGTGIAGIAAAPRTIAADGQRSAESAPTSVRSRNGEFAH